MKKTHWIRFAAGAALLTALLLLDNRRLTVTELTVAHPQLPTAFTGLRIAHISDLHNASFGKNNARLLAKLRQQKPDLIVITGDLVDSRNTDLQTGIAFGAGAAAIAPTYYVSGNHEARLSDYSVLSEGLAAAGVTVLENSSVTLTRGSDSIRLLGIRDPSFTVSYLTGDSEAAAKAAITALEPAEEAFTVLLSHRPELFSVYADMNIDLVFSGHAHGGQIRLPLLGGLFAPNQGFLPRYDAGLYRDDTTWMAVSRGLGSSLMPLRILNPPELILVTLTQ